MFPYLGQQFISKKHLTGNKEHLTLWLRWKDRNRILSAATKSSGLFSLIKSASRALIEQTIFRLSGKEFNLAIAVRLSNVTDDSKYPGLCNPQTDLCAATKLVRKTLRDWPNNYHQNLRTRQCKLERFFYYAITVTAGEQRRYAIACMLGLPLSNTARLNNLKLLLDGLHFSSPLLPTVCK